jgi:hypothetical protein
MFQTPKITYLLTAEKANEIKYLEIEQNDVENETKNLENQGYTVKAVVYRIEKESK